ncbi:hypothetical protein M2428_003023 [Arthrobacter sp. ES3-54]|nr:hypothetical protein [Arthrobacter sp. ES3-54]
MKVDVRVLTQVAEYLGNYVYLLLDPRTMAPFYVGKGTGARAVQHGLDAEVCRLPTTNHRWSTLEK